MAGLTAAVAASVLAGVIATRVFELEWQADWRLVATGAVARSLSDSIGAAAVTAEQDAARAQALLVVSREGEELEAFLAELRDFSAVAHYIKEIEEQAVVPVPAGITGFSIARD